ncbi:MAG: Competence protein CoiA-like family protein, partial [Firmicutes bacterium]|nr:Competence protein CoiA-like family protein [Bacillota bacterium]
MLTARLDGMIIRVNEREWEDQEAFLRQAIKEKRVFAPCCEAALILRWGKRRIRHFAHPPRVSCPFERWGEPESPEHVAGKVLLYDWCRTHLAAQTQLLALEYPLRATFQRPDVYLELKDGTRFALEYQRSAISVGEWTERHEGYVSQGIHDIWIFGDNRHADAQLSDDQKEKWALREPGMLFLKLRAFEGAAMVRTAYEVPYWRYAVQDEQLWAPLELAARVGREVSPWYKRSALERLASVAFMDSTTGELSIYRAMRELPAHVDTRMASVVHRVHLDSEGLELTPAGFITPADHKRLAQHVERVARVEATIRAQQATAVSEQVDPPQVKMAPDQPMPGDMPPYFQQLARRREQQVSRFPDARTFLLGEQDAEQKR